MTRGRRSEREPRRLVRILAPVLVGAALASLGAIAVANQIATGRLDQEQSLVQLEELQRSRTRAITDGLDRLRTSVSLIASDRAVVEALIDLRAGVAELDQAVAEGVELLTPDEEDALREVIVELLDDDSLERALLEGGRTAITLDELLSPDPTARYLQHRYLRTPRPVGGAPDPAAGVPDNGDPDTGDPGATYDRAHQQHAEALARLSGAFPDLWLVELEGDRVVHTVVGGPELGSQITAGGLGDTIVGELFADELRRTTAGEVALSDVGPYLVGPSLFLAELVRDGGEIIGAIAVRVPIGTLDALMTAEERWSEVGLGDTGQTFIVGRDQRLRSSARRHIEDPAGHLDALRRRGDTELAEIVAATGSTVLVTPVETTPVRTALDDRRFVGRAAGLDAGDTLTVAAPLGVPGLDWVVVAQIDRREAMAESSRQLTRQLLLAALLLPAVAAAGALLARYLVRPVRPLVAAAEQVATGAGTSGLDDPSRDEFGHLARELDRAATSLAADRQRFAAEHAAIDELLMAALPPAAAAAVKEGRPEVATSTGTATVVAIGIDPANPELTARTDGTIDDSTTDQDEVDLEQLIDRHDEITATIDSTAVAIGAERIRASGDRLLYVVGIDQDDDGVETARRFATSIIDTDPDVHIGIATGSVTAAVVGGARPTMTVWGPPVRTALGLIASGRPGEILIDTDPT